MHGKNSSLVQQLDALVTFTLIFTGLTLFILNNIADLFLEMGIKEMWLQRTIILTPVLAAVFFVIVRVSRRQPHTTELAQHSLTERKQELQTLRKKSLKAILIVLGITALYALIVSGWFDAYLKFNSPLSGLLIVYLAVIPRLISDLIQLSQVRKIIAILSAGNSALNSSW
jgi:Ca2+/Na+ antiporter